MHDSAGPVSAHGQSQAAARTSSGPGATLDPCLRPPRSVNHRPCPAVESQREDRQYDPSERSVRGNVVSSLIMDSALGQDRDFGFGAKEKKKEGGKEEAKSRARSQNLPFGKRALACRPRIPCQPAPSATPRISSPQHGARSLSGNWDLTLVSTKETDATLPLHLSEAACKILCALLPLASPHKIGPGSCAADHPPSRSSAENSSHPHPNRIVTLLLACALTWSGAAAGSRHTLTPLSNLSSYGGPRPPAPQAALLLGGHPSRHCRICTWSRRHHHRRCPLS